MLYPKGEKGGPKGSSMCIWPNVISLKHILITKVNTLYNYIRIKKANKKSQPTEAWYFKMISLVVKGGDETLY